MLLRLAEPHDALAVARVHVRAWQAGYRHVLPDDYLARLRPEERAARYDLANRDARRPLTIVAVKAQEILGFATMVLARDGEETEQGELCALYVDPREWGRGIGRALVADARQRLLELGCRRAVLWVLAGNTRAEMFYRADGWMPDGRTRTDHVWEIAVDEIRYARALRP